jgi:DeoR family transcriptional regulator, fructose operon transcriptional repressor
MNFQKRKALILDLLEKEDVLDIRKLSQSLSVSEITVRRDLNILTEKGLIVRTHGGAMSLKSSREKLDFINKSAVRKEEKEYIASLAVERIIDGDVVFLDCGSTVYCMAPLLKGRRIKVITNSLPLAHALMNSGIELNLIGGEVDQDRLAVHGKAALEHVRQYNATKAFIGVDGISLNGGLSANSEKEAELSVAIAKQSREVFLLCDSSKLEQDKYLRFAQLSLADHLITDSKAPAEILDSYRKTGLDVIN